MEQATNNPSALSERAKSHSATQTGRVLLLPNGSLAEMVYRPAEEKSFFCVARDGRVAYERDAIYRGERYAPLSPNNPLVSHGVVLFPSEPAEYESESKLAQAIQAFIHNYVDLSPLFEQLAAYYVLF